MTGESLITKCAICDELLSVGPHLSIVIPLYKSEDHIAGLLDYLEKIQGNIEGGISVTFVIDGSPQNEYLILNSMAQSFPFPVSIIRLSKNFGVGPALHAALSNCGGCATVVFGADLQEPFELFVSFYQKIIVHGVDVTLGQRKSREDPLMMKFFANFYWWINRRFLANDTPKGGFDVFGLSKRARETVVALPELNTNIASQLQWIGFNREYVAFDRVARQSGKSSWTMRRKVKLFSDSIYGFTGAPIAVITTIGFVSTFILTVLSILTVFGSIFELINVPGYATLVLVVALGQSVTITSCGIIGGYVFRTFENSKGRPRYIISDVEMHPISSKSFGN